MNPLKRSLATTLLLAPLLAFAAEPATPPPPPSEHAMEMGKEMMEGHGSEEGHKGKRCKSKGMGSCCPMMGKGMHPPGGMVVIPPLPPGNEKQQLLMQAEIQQKVAEIVSKYAGQLK